MGDADGHRIDEEMLREMEADLRAANDVEPRFVHCGTCDQTIECGIWDGCPEKLARHACPIQKRSDAAMVTALLEMTERKRKGEPARIELGEGFMLTHESCRKALDEVMARCPGSGIHVFRREDGRATCHKCYGQVPVSDLGRMDDHKWGGS